MEKIESLFHYTRKCDTLCEILRAGLRYSYSFEPHSKRTSYGENWELEDNVEIMGAENPLYGIAIPMICLCDIPVTEATNHRNKYGNYCIGFRKSKVRESVIVNPILYASSPWVYEAIESLVNYLPTHNDWNNRYKKIGKILGEEKDLIKCIRKLQEATSSGEFTRDVRFDELFMAAVNMMVTITKPYDSVFFNSSKKVNGNLENYYNEHEWRFFFTEAGMIIKKITKRQFERKKTHLNKKMWREKSRSSYIKMENQDDIITCIIVSNEEEKSKVTKSILESQILLGNNASNDQKERVIEKIISFEKLDCITKEYREMIESEFTHEISRMLI